MSAATRIVVSPYPTMPGPEAAWAFARVRELVDAGEEVLVVSPRPSAAHLHADPGGLRGAGRLLRYTAGCGHALVRLDAAALRADTDSTALLAPRAALAAALRRAGELEVVLDRVPASVSSRWATMVLGPAGRVVVGDDAARAALAVAGVDPARIAVDPGIAGPGPAAPGRPHPDPIGGSVPGEAVASASAIEDLIRRRAAEAQPSSEATAAAASAARPLRHLVPLERPRVATRKPGVATVKRLQLRLLAWSFDQVIQHVNALQRATIESIDALEERIDPPSR